MEGVAEAAGLGRGVDFVPGGSADQCAAVARATRATLAKVKSRAITARQPSVPKRMEVDTG